LWSKRSAEKVTAKFKDTVVLKTSPWRVVNIEPGDVKRRDIRLGDIQNEDIDEGLTLVMRTAN